MQRNGEALATLDALSKLIPRQRPECPHQLGRWVLRTRKSTRTYRDGGERPDALRGGRMVTVVSGCVYAAGHTGAHRTSEGRDWT